MERYAKYIFLGLHDYIFQADNVDENYNQGGGDIAEEDDDDNNNHGAGIVAEDVIQARVNHFPHTWKCDKRSRRCKTCLADICGSGYEIARHSMANQSQQCQHCGQAVCKSHQVLLCVTCSNKFSPRNPENVDDNDYNSG